ncbi:MAG: carboxypeptidase regulatory-like domain-containing protein, partial [Acidobacteria bacterium]|nr:carboxypeptidase regulatory-like domain-containing protein [Acidobacteriota bacterium]
MVKMRLGFILSALLTLPLAAQSTATLFGLVTDQSGSAIPGATVRVSNSMTGFSGQQATANDGQFQFVNVPFQTYTIRIEKAGFDPSERSISLRSNIPFRL